jgi:hypothetical protein
MTRQYLRLQRISTVPRYSQAEIKNCYDQLGGRSGSTSDAVSKVSERIGVCKLSIVR